MGVFSQLLCLVIQLKMGSSQLLLQARHFLLQLQIRMPRLLLLPCQFLNIRAMLIELILVSLHFILKTGVRLLEVVDLSLKIQYLCVKRFVAISTSRQVLVLFLKLRVFLLKPR